MGVFSALCVGSRFAMVLVYGIINFLEAIAYWFVYSVFSPMLPGVVFDFNDFGQFCPFVHLLMENDYFIFTNVGKSPLIIHEASASCGCTVPEYTLEPIMPGKTGKISVTYNGKGRRPGVFRKSITVHNNGKQSPVRLYIEGEMIDDTPPELIKENELYQNIYQ